MPLLTLIQYGTPVILLGLIISNVRLNIMVNNLVDNIKDMKSNVLWLDEFKQFEKRFEKVESKVNGL